MSRTAVLPPSAPFADTAILLFDGVCNLCNRWVHFVISHDAQAHFRFAALQSSVGQRLLEAHGLSGDRVDTIVLLENGRCYIRSDAVVHIAPHLSGGWRLLRFLSVVPRPLRDWAYRQVVTHRYQWFGRRETCMVPTPELRARFLES
jgi:predicted DCC family thiol-disulfide oxidoreductase YuxK